MPPLAWWDFSHYRRRRTPSGGNDSSAAAEEGQGQQEEDAEEGGGAGADAPVDVGEGEVAVFDERFAIEKEKLSMLLSIWNARQSKITHEESRLVSRMNWILGSQAFFLVAFATALVPLMDPDQTNQKLLKVFLYLVPSIAFAHIILFWLAMCFNKKTLNKQNELQFCLDGLILQSLEKCSPAHAREAIWKKGKDISRDAGNLCFDDRIDIPMWVGRNLVLLTMLVGWGVIFGYLDEPEVSAVGASNCTS